MYVTALRLYIQFGIRPFTPLHSCVIKTIHIQGTSPNVEILFSHAIRLSGANSFLYEKYPLRKGAQLARNAARFNGSLRCAQLHGVYEDIQLLLDNEEHRTFYLFIVSEMLTIIK